MIVVGIINSCLYAVNFNEVLNINRPLDSKSIYITYHSGTFETVDGVTSDIINVKFATFTSPAKSAAVMQEFLKAVQTNLQIFDFTAYI